MLSIKTTPLLLFLLLLIVLVISVLVGNSISSKEGFVSFQQTKNSLDLVSIPTYSSSNYTVKLFDQLYFDNKNGNIIEVDSTRHSGNTDTTGISIATTYVSARSSSSSSTSYKNIINGTTVVPQDTPPSQITTTASSYQSYMYLSQSVNTDFYTLFCFPWNTDTYIHIINNTTNIQEKSFYFNAQGEMKNYDYPDNTKLGLTSYIPYIKPADNSTADPFYDPQKALYKLASFVKYDITNGNLIIQTAQDGTSKSITVYSRTGTSTVVSTAGTITNTPTSVSSASFAPFTVVDTLGQNLVLYLPYETKTVIALIGFANASLTSLTLNNVVRFTATAVDSGNTKTPGMNTGTNPNPGFNMAPPTQDSAMSEYFKWYWYWKNTGASTSKLNYSDDYLLKTQIVPPVCPACSTGSTCTNCGGQGGSGTVSQTGKTVVGGNKVGTGGRPENVSEKSSGTLSSNSGANTIGGVLNNTVDKVTDVAGAGLVGAGMAVGGVALGAGALGSSAINTTGSVIKGVSKDVTGLAGGAGTGVKDVLMQNQGRGQGQGFGPTNRSQTGDQSQLNAQLYGQDNTSSVGPDGKKLDINRTEGSFQSPYGTTTGTQSGDQYSYYGALPSKGNANFMPVTADFSAFGR
uniref:Uncharacterized protein n=1 Tax=viral metagenome TaxID=1070528 RepID=A0A6C0L7F7_9ZZZZ